MRTKIQTTFILILLVSSLVMAGCGSSKNEFQVGMEADGSRVELAPGQTLIVSLESNPSTGYDWYISGVDENILKPVGGVEYSEASNDEQLVGAPVVETFRFEAVDSGTTTLTLTYDRAWGETVPPEATFTLTVVVR